jgi:hypothetical protein
MQHIWPELRSSPAPAYFDGVGMPAVLEVRFGFNPQDPCDGPLDKNGDGYTYVEDHLNGADPIVFVDYAVRR